MRVLVAILVLINIGYWAWRSYQSDVPETVSVESDTGIPKLTLLSERGQELAGSEEGSEALPSPTPPPPPVSAIRCYTLGPLSGEKNAKAVESAVVDAGFPASLRSYDQQEVSGYWVYLEPADSRRKALALAKELAQKGIKDYYVVGDGEFENAVSLGLFSEKARAERRAEYIRSLGYDPQSSVRYRTRTLYWLDYQEEGDSELRADIWTQVATDADNLQRLDRACEAVSAD